MRLLDRYLLRELAISLIYCLSGFLLFWMTFDLFGRLDDFHDNGIPPLQIARFYLVNIPEFLVLVVPIALLLGLLYAMTNHSRHNELIAMRAAGISLWRITLPYFCVGFAFSVLVFVMNELWVPTSADRAAQIMNVGRQKRQAHRTHSETRNHIFQNARGDRQWKIESFNLDSSEMFNLEVKWKKPDGAIRYLFAERAEYSDRNVWVFTNVSIFDYPANGSRLPFKRQEASMEAPEFSETPEQIKSEIKVSEILNQVALKRAQLSLSEIHSYRKLHTEINEKTERFLNLQQQGRLAEPWTCLVVVLLAVPFGALSGRRNVFVGVAASIFICFAYFILMQFSLALGSGGTIPPWAAAWFPNILGAGVGITLMMRAN